MRPVIIAEAGVNHNGDLARAEELIDVAAAAGADTVKFQVFQSDALVTVAAKKAPYQRENTDPSETQKTMLARLELGEDALRSLCERCAERGVQFLATPFDHQSLDFLVDKLTVNELKISSGDLTNGPLLLRSAQSARPIILSTGMGTLEEVRAALEVIAFGYLRPNEIPNADALAKVYESAQGKKRLAKNVTLLHATTAYPAPDNEINLRAMETLRNQFGLKTGLSDHSAGISVPIAAAALGASVIEKHFTLDHELPGPDHKASLNPDELKSMVAGVRTVSLAMGNGDKTPTPSERQNMDIVRRGLVAARPIRSGEKLSEDNLIAKRPAMGASPMRYWHLLNQKALRDYAVDELIDP